MTCSWLVSPGSVYSSGDDLFDFKFTMFPPFFLALPLPKYFVFFHSFVVTSSMHRNGLHLSFLLSISLPSLAHHRDYDYWFVLFVWICVCVCLVSTCFCLYMRVNWLQPMPISDSFPFSILCLPFLVPQQLYPIPNMCDCFLLHTRTCLVCKPKSL